VFYTGERSRGDYWLGIGTPIGLTTDTERLGVSIRTGGRF
jgi:hypothetical protein